MPKEITFTKRLDNGKTVERVASTPNEVVQLRFDGWTEKKTSAAPVPGPPAGGDKRPAGGGK